jgi:hypothetical protein
MQEKCCRNVPCLAHMEQGPSPSTLSTSPLPYLPGYWGLGPIVTLNKDLDSGVDTCKQPNPELVALGKCMLILFFISRPAAILSF